MNNLTDFALFLSTRNLLGNFRQKSVGLQFEVSCRLWGAAISCRAGYLVPTCVQTDTVFVLCAYFC